MDNNPVKILLIEDNPGDAPLIQEILAEARSVELNLEHVHRLSTGLARLAEGGIDLILLDLSLPDSQGLETFLQVQAQTLRIPIVVLTGLDDEKLAAKAVGTGAQDYLIKEELADKVLVRAIRKTIARKHAEEALRESEEHFRGLAQAATYAIINIDTGGHIRFFNQAAERIFGYTATEIIGQPVEVLIPEAYRARHKQAFELFLETGQPAIIGQVRELTGLRKGGVVFPLEISITKVPWGGEVIFTVIIRDITKRKQTEETLRKWAHIFEHAAWGVSIGNPDDDTFKMVNPAYAKMHGYTAEELIGTPILDVCAPEEQAKFSEQTRITTQEGHYIFETKHIRKDGTTFPIQVNATAVKDEDGNVLYRAVNIQDITERKQAEVMLTKLTRIIEQTPDHVMITDKEGVIEYVNPAFEKLTGYAGEKIIGYTPRILKSGQHEQRFYEELWETILDGRVFRGVFINRKKNGELFYEENTITPLRDEQGTITRFVSTGKDITDRKIAEERLAALNLASRAMASSLDLDIVLEQTMAEVKTLLNVVGAAVLLHNPASDELIFVAKAGPYLDTMMGTRMPVTAGVAGWAFREKQSALVNDVQEDPRFYNRIDTQTGLTTRSILAVPLIFKEKVSGVIEVINKIEGAFTPQDLELLEALASMSAIAIKNAQLHTETEDWAKQLAVLHELDQVITGSLHVDEIYQAFAHHVTRLFPYDRMSIALVEEGGEGFLITYAVDEGHALPLVGSQLPLESSIIGWVVSQAQPLLFNDDTSDIPFPQDVPMTATDIQSSMIIPLRIKGEVIGTWNIGSQEAGTYSSNDLEIALSLADQLAIAIENAQLYEAEQTQRQRIEALQTATAVVNGTLDLAEVMDRLLEELEKVIPSDSSAVLLLEGETLRVAAVRGVIDRTIIGSQFPRTEENRIIEQSQQPLILADVQTEPRFQVMVYDHIRCWMGVPLIAEGCFIGYFTVDNSQPGVYSQADADLAMSFANQAAIAVEKARLFADLKQQMKALREAQYELVQSEKMAAIGRLSTSLAHEINNPIQAIQNSLTLIKEEAGDQAPLEKVDFFTDIAKTELDRVATIIRRMREFSRTPRREQADDPDSAPIGDFYHLSRDDAQTIDLYDILEEILNLTNKQLQNSEVKVKRTWADHLPPVQGDPDQLKQVFMNLTLNAVDAMIEPGGTLHIQIKPDQTNLHSNQPRPVVRIEFSDTGAGVRPEVLPHLFEPLFSTKTQGWGFGLFTSYKIIEAHHGQITVASQVGKGTTFTILLPLEQP